MLFVCLVEVVHIGQDNTFNFFIPQAVQLGKFDGDTLTYFGLTNFGIFPLRFKKCVLLEDKLLMIGNSRDGPSAVIRNLICYAMYI